MKYKTIFFLRLFPGLNLFLKRPKNCIIIKIMRVPGMTIAKLDIAIIERLSEFWKSFKIRSEKKRNRHIRIISRIIILMIVVLVLLIPFLAFILLFEFMINQAN